MALQTYTIDKIHLYITGLSKVVFWWVKLTVDASIHFCICTLNYSNFYPPFSTTTTTFLFCIDESTQQKSDFGDEDEDDDEEEEEEEAGAAKKGKQVKRQYLSLFATSGFKLNEVHFVILN